MSHFPSDEEFDAMISSGHCLKHGNLALRLSCRILLCDGRDKSIKRISIAHSKNGWSEFVLYKRINFPGRYEAGIIYSPGPEWKNQERFPWLIHRFFARHQDVCFDMAHKSYTDLVADGARIIWQGA